MKESTFIVNGMSCNGCARKIENALTETKGVKTSRIDFSKREAYVQYDETQTTLEAIQNVVIQKGYSIE
ncbi:MULTISPECIES: heavy-metal-associated domain-containing protein [Lysinibacillus]|nr:MULTISPECIES: cation transporter [Lysinibacillus]